MRALVLVAAAFSLAACGSGSSSGGAAAPPPASPSPEPAGSPTTAQPTIPSPTSPTPNPTSPTPAPPTPPPPSTPTPAPPQPDRFVDVERIDSDAECDAMVPAPVPAPLTVNADAPQVGGGCSQGLSEGTGHVAAVSKFMSGGMQWQVFGPGGQPEQSLSITSDLWPQPEGWQGVQAATGGTPISLSVLTFFADGSPRRTEQPQASGFSPQFWRVAPDPQGGAAVAWWGPTGPGQDPICAGEVRRYDTSGAPIAPAGRTGCNVATVGVSTAGETLVLEPVAAGTTTIRWLRADGTPAAAPSQDGLAGVGELLPLLDGSLVLVRGPYVWRYPHLAPAGEPPPAWLATRTGQTFRFTRGNAGYAFFPQAGVHSSSCTQVVELVAPSGRPCVKLTFRRDGNACVTGSIDQGWDGTVVQQNGLGACGWRVWPRLLAGG
jgi:hypothetical protein